MRTGPLLQDVRFLLTEESPLRWTSLGLLTLLAATMEAVGAGLVLVLIQAVAEDSAGAPDATDLVGGLPKIPLVTEDLRVLSALVGAFFLARGVVMLGQTYALNRLARNAGARIARRLVRAYLATDYEFHLTGNSADLVRTAHQSAGQVASLVLNGLLYVVSESILAVAVLIVLIIALPLPGVLGLALLGIVAVGLLAVLRGELDRQGKAQQALARDSLQSLHESLRLVREIQMFNAVPQFVERFQRIRFDFARSQYLTATMESSPRVVLETLVVLGLVSVVAIQAGSQGTASTIGGLAAVGYAALRILPSVSRIATQLNAVNFGREAVRLVAADMRRAEEGVQGRTRGEGGGAPSRLGDGPIRLRDVGYRHPGATVAALADVDLTVAQGESLAIVGRTGAGKTTLVLVLLGLLEPTSGSVEVSGIPISNSPSEWQSLIGFIPQEVQLLDGTLAENIAFGQRPSDIDRDQVRWALGLAQLTEVVDGLPQGIDSPVGEFGNKLSGGQRQRVAIARAMYRDPRIVVMDEGTSSIDQATEAELLSVLRKATEGRTVIIVAHRWATVARCDRVALVEAGTVKRIFTPAAMDDGTRALLGRDSEIRNETTGG